LPWYSRLNYKTDDNTYAGKYASDFSRLGVTAANKDESVSKYHSPGIPHSSIEYPVQLILNQPKKVKNRVVGKVVAERIPYTHARLLHSGQAGFYSASPQVAETSLCARDAVGVIFYENAIQHTPEPP
jgi:hypothetical protein